MFRKLSSIIRNQRKSNMLLGRWSTIMTDNYSNPKNNVAIDFNIDSANHDHCGGELCNSEIKIKQKIIVGKKKDTTTKSIYNDEMYPYII